MNFNGQDVIVRIGAVDNSEAGFENARQNMKKTADSGADLQSKMSASFSKIRTHWLAATAAIAGAVYGLKKAWDLMEQAAQFEEMKTGLNSLSAQYGMTADSAIAMVKAISNGQLSLKQSGELAAKAFTMGLDPSHVKTFIEQAERLTDVVGGDIPSAFEAMERAAATGRAKSLVQYGIVVDLTRVVKEWAEKNNVAVESIDEMSLTQLRANAIMEAAAEKIGKMGAATESVADKMARLKATWEDIGTVSGGFLLRIVQGITGAFQGLASIILYSVGAGAKFGSLLAQFDNWVNKGQNKDAIKKMNDWKDASDAAFAAAMDMAKKGNQSLQDMISGTDRAKVAVTGLKTAMSAQDIGPGQKMIDGMIIDTSKTTKQQTALLDSWKKTLQDLNKEIQLSGFSDEFQKKIEEIQIKAKGLAEEYRGISGARIKIQEWETREIARIQNESRFQDIEAVRKGNEEKARMSQQMLEKFFKDEEDVRQKRISEAEVTRQELDRIHQEILRDEDAQLAQQQANYQTAWQNIMNMANQIGGEAGAGMGQMAANLKGITDIFGGQDQYAQQEEAIYAHWESVLGTYVAGYTTLDELHTAAVNRDIQLENTKKNQTLSMASAGFGMMAGLAKSFYALSGQQSKTAFEAYKAFAIAQAVVDTYRAATSAYAAMAGIFPAPLWGVVAAAAAIAAGLANVKAIKDQQPGGTGAATAPSAGSAGGFSYTQPTAPVWDETKAKTAETKTPMINVHIYGDVVDHDQFARTLLPSLTKAMEDRVEQ